MQGSLEGLRKVCVELEVRKVEEVESKLEGAVVDETIAKFLQLFVVMLLQGSIHYPFVSFSPFFSQPITSGLDSYNF